MRWLVTGLCVVTVVSVMAVRWWRSANIGSVQRGADVALAQGCQGCHGGPGESPPLPRSFAELDAVDEATAREWILDGMPRPAREDRELRGALDTAVIRMPAWRGRLSDAEVDDLVDYLRALTAADLPEDPAVRTGYAVAERLGCFGYLAPAATAMGTIASCLRRDA
jgi:mono/diheme cytochrome c family protein